MQAYSLQDFYFAIYIPFPHVAISETMACFTILVLPTLPPSMPEPCQFAFCLGLLNQFCSIFRAACKKSLIFPSAKQTFERRQQRMRSCRSLVSVSVLQSWFPSLSRSVRMSLRPLSHWHETLHLQVKVVTKSRIVAGSFEVRPTARAGSAFSQPFGPAKCQS